MSHKKQSKALASVSVQSVKGAADDINLASLRRSDPAIERILHTVSHVVVYELDAESQLPAAAAGGITDSKQWQRKGIEGPLFVVRRLEKDNRTSLQMIVLNRQSPQNLVVPIDALASIEQQTQFLFYRTRALFGSEVVGLWFHELSECLSTQRVIKNFLPKPKPAPSDDDSGDDAPAPPPAAATRHAPQSGVMSVADLERQLSYPPTSSGAATPAAASAGGGARGVRLVGPANFTRRVKLEPSAAADGAVSVKLEPFSGGVKHEPGSDAFAHPHAPAHAHAHHSHRAGAWPYGYGAGGGYGYDHHSHSHAHAHSISRSDFQRELMWWALHDPSFVDSLYHRFVMRMRHDRFHHPQSHSHASHHHNHSYHPHPHAAMNPSAAAAIHHFHHPPTAAAGSHSHAHAHSHAASMYGPPHHAGFHTPTAASSAAFPFSMGHRHSHSIATAPAAVPAADAASPTAAPAGASASASALGVRLARPSAFARRPNTAS